MLDWNDLSFFLALARQGRLAPAARRLKVDHTTVSRRVSELERSLDQKLFDRSSDGFSLTEDGQRLLPLAETMERQVQAILASKEEVSSSGKVRIASMEGIGTLYLARHLPRLTIKDGGFHIELVTSPALINLTRRDADVSISFVPPMGQRLQVKKIGSFRLFLYASAGYLQEHGDPVDAADLARHMFVDYIEEFIQIQEVNWLADVIKAPQVRFRSSSMLAQASAAAAGGGLVLLPTFAGDPDPRLEPVLRNHVYTERPIFLGTHEDLAWVPRIRSVVRAIEAQVTSDQKALMGERV